MDWNGNPVEVIAYGDSRTPAGEVQVYKYTYDPMKRKLTFTDPRGLVTKYAYDERSLLTKQTYWNGSDVMEYNDLGQLVKKSDRKGQIITMSYDEMGRNTKVSHYLSEAAYQSSDEEYEVFTEYDNRGNAVRISNPNLIEYYVYGAQTTLFRYKTLPKLGTRKTKLF